MPSWMGEAPIKDRRVLGSALFEFFDAGFEAGTLAETDGEWLAPR